MIRRGIIIFAATALFFIAAPLSYAGVIAQQTTFSSQASSTNTDIQLYTYYLGTNFSGTAQDLKLKFDSLGNSWLATLHCDTNSTYDGTGPCGSYAMGSGAFEAAASGEIDHTADFSTSGLVFDQTKHYFFDLIFDPPGGLWADFPILYGSSDPDAYADGACQSGFSNAGFCTSVPDIYFVLETVNPPDTTAPIITIESGPADGSYASTTSVTYTFSTDDPTAVTTCSWDGMATSTCSSPFATSTLSDGTHLFTLIATDTANNSATSTRSVIIDTLAPTLTIDSGVDEGAATSTNAISFAFSSTDGTAAFSCAWDGLATSTCSSPFASTTMADGSHTFALSVTDPAGNATSTLRSFTIDITAPELSGTPADQFAEATGASTTVSYTLPTALDARDGATTVSCTPDSGWGFALGSTTVVCSTEDALGNTASSTFVVGVRDTTAPVVTLTGSASISLTVGDSFTDPGATALDIVDGTTPVIITGSVDTGTAGTYTLTYTSTDTAGNIDSTTRSVIVSNPAPPPPPSGGGNGGGNGPPIENPSQGLPQGIVLGTQTNALQHASPKAIEVIKSIMPPISIKMPGSKKAEAISATRVDSTEETKKPDTSVVTPQDKPKPVGKKNDLGAAAATAGFTFSWYWAVVFGAAALGAVLLVRRLTR